MGLGVGVSGSDFLSLVKIIANAITIPKTTKAATTTRMIMPLFDLEWKGKLCIFWCQKLKKQRKKERKKLRSFPKCPRSLLLVKLVLLKSLLDSVIKN